MKHACRAPDDRARRGTTAAGLAGSGVGLVAVAAVLLAAAVPARAQMYHLYLDCKGTVTAGSSKAAGGGPRPADRVSGEKDEEAARSAITATTEDRGDTRGDFNSRIRTSGAFQKVKSDGGAQLLLALRDNNMTAFVQRSNVLPTGERMKYVATRTHYTAVYEPQRGSRAYGEFQGGWMLKWYPPFEKVVATRIAIDRQTGELEGEMVAPGGEIIGLIDMTCEPRRDGDGPAPRF